MTQIPIKKETIDKIAQQNKIANPGKACPHRRWVCKPRLRH